MTDKVSRYETLLLGRTIKEIRGAEIGSERIEMEDEHGTVVSMWHEPDWCESVEVNEIVGDIADLIGSPLLRAEEATNEGATSEWGDTQTWTFYKLATIKGEVVLRWLGSSNGYYSETVTYGITVASHVEKMKHYLGADHLPEDLL